MQIKEYVKIKIKMLDKNIEKMVFKTGNSGTDIRSAIKTIILPGERKLIDCGFQMEIPEGYEAQIRSRSGLAIKHGISVLNQPGTIDQNYRGNICVILINSGNEDFFIKPGDRIAQMVIAKVEEPFFEFVEELSETERGEGGFGSSGIL